MWHGSFLLHQTKTLGTRAMWPDHPSALPLGKDKREHKTSQILINASVASLGMLGRDGRDDRWAPFRAAVPRC
jgi:hypothetical protein